MKRKLIDYLPEYLQEYTEEKAALEAVEPELDNIWLYSEEMLKETFVLTEGKYGAGRMEKILILRPKDTDSLEHRNVRVLAKINEAQPYTMIALNRFLTAAVGEGNYEANLDAEQYILDIQILLKDLGKIKGIREYVEEITPLNMVLYYTGKQAAECLVDIQTESCLTMRGNFFPRYNMEYLLLDGTWKLDGTYSLSGYKSEEEELYPAYLRITAEASVEVETSTQLTAEQDAWYLDGTVLLDGSRLLNAEAKKYEL
ncbi:MAG: DUF2313 domain-containing protein [Lachnospiraceae bacterium]|nr:DUF2313 domain-containing protein [Lachnospiraceae bacterium]